MCKHAGKERGERERKLRKDVFVNAWVCVCTNDRREIPENDASVCERERKPKKV